MTGWARAWGAPGAKLGCAPEIPAHCSAAASKPMPMRRLAACKARLASWPCSAGAQAAMPRPCCRASRGAGKTFGARRHHSHIQKRARLRRGEATQAWPHARQPLPRQASAQRTSRQGLKQLARTELSRALCKSGGGSPKRAQARGRSQARLRTTHRRGHTPSTQQSHRGSPPCAQSGAGHIIFAALRESNHIPLPPQPTEQAQHNSQACELSTLEDKPQAAGACQLWQPNRLPPASNPRAPFAAL